MEETKQEEQEVVINTHANQQQGILVLTLIMKGCYVEMYSERQVSFCLQNCKYKLICYFVKF